MNWILKFAILWVIASIIGNLISKLLNHKPENMNIVFLISVISFFAGIIIELFIDIKEDLN